MKKENIFSKIWNNHLLMMVLCCAIPIIIFIIAVYVYGVSKTYLYWLILLLCPLSHYFMMKGMHNKKNKKGGDCH